MAYHVAATVDGGAISVLRERLRRAFGARVLDPLHGRYTHQNWAQISTLDLRSALREVGALQSSVTLRHTTLVGYPA